MNNDQIKRVLVAGIGNRLMGDDGFGPRVIDLLSSINVPDNVELRDFGTAGLTIATDLEEFDLVIFLDSMQMEGEYGHLFKTQLVVEENLEDIGELARTSLHEVGLEGLLRFSKAIGTLPAEVYLIGCKPKNIEPSLDLSSEVEKASHKAVDMVIDIIESHS